MQHLSVPIENEEMRKRENIRVATQKRIVLIVPAVIDFHDDVIPRKHLGDNPVYLSFDIDCLDPSYAPGTGTPVCGGLTSHQAAAIIRGLAGINLVGMDIVEVAPAYDVGEITALAGATMAWEMINLYANRPA